MTIQRCFLGSTENINTPTVQENATSQLSQGQTDASQGAVTSLASRGQNLNIELEITQEEGVQSQPGAPAKRPAEQLYERLEGRKTGEVSSWRSRLNSMLSTMMSRLPLMPLSTMAPVKVQILNTTGMESRPRSRIPDLVRAHCFKRTMEVPRPIKNLGYAVQHSWQGRKGLRQLYGMETALFNQLDALHAGNECRTRNTDLKSRLENLNLGDRGKPLQETLSQLLTQLQSSAEHQLVILGQHQGVIKPDGRLNDQYRPPATKDFVQSLNTNRSGHDLSRELLALWGHVNITDCSVESLLKDFVRLGVNMSHQSTEIPYGRQRDPNDQTALSKARLVLDTLTLMEVARIIEKAELVTAGTPTDDQIRLLSKQVAELGEQRYPENPVKVFTDMGFVSHKSLEADYDAVKAFLNAFKKEDHGVNILARSVMETPDKENFKQKLKYVIQTLDKGETLTFNRKYGGGANLKYKSCVPVPVLYVGGKAVADRSYSMSLSRSEKGIEINFGRDFGSSLNIFLEVGYDVFPEFFNDLGKVLGGGRELGIIARIFKGELGPTFQYTNQNGLTLTLPENEAGNFVDGLVDGGLDPVSLLRKGMEQKVKEGSKCSLDLDLSVGSAFRVEVGGIEEGSLDAVNRIGAGVSSQFNLMNATRERSTTRSRDSVKKAASDNRPRFMNKTSAGVYLAANNIALHSMEEGRLQNENKGNLLSADIAFTDQVSQKSELQLKAAKPLKGSEVTGLIGEFDRTFTDNESVSALTAIKHSADPKEQLNRLNQLFAEKAPENDSQYDLLQKLHNLTVRHLSNDGKNAPLLSAASYSVSYTNLHRLNHESLMDKLLSRLSPKSQPSVSRRVKHLMKQDPSLDSLIKSLQKKRHCKASVALELKDEVKIKADRGLLDGTLGPEDIARMLKKPENVRIKSIDVTRKVEKSEGMSFPILISASSSASVSMEKNLGTVTFKYGRDQDKPSGYSLNGETNAPPRSQIINPNVIRQKQNVFSDRSGSTETQGGISMIVGMQGTSATSSVYAVGTQEQTELRQGQGVQQQGPVTTLARDGQLQQPSASLTQADGVPPKHKSASRRIKGALNKLAKVMCMTPSESGRASAPHGRRSFQESLAILHAQHAQASTRTGSAEGSGTTSGGPQQDSSHRLGRPTPQKETYVPTLDTIHEHGNGGEPGGSFLMFLHRSGNEPVVNRPSEIQEIGPAADSPTPITREEGETSAATAKRVNQETPTVERKEAKSKRLISKFTDRLRFSKLIDIFRGKSSGPEEISSRGDTSRLSDVRRVAGQDGYFYFLPPDGKLHRYDPTTNEVLKTGLKDIKDIKLGADLRPYALQVERGEQGEPAGKIIRLERNGTEAARLNIDVPYGIRDMVVSDKGSAVYTLNSEGQLHYHNLGTPGTGARASSPPLEVPFDAPRAIAAAHDGSVWMLDADGSAWRGQPTKSATGGEGLKWDKIGSHSEPLVGLETLPDGDVAGRDQQGRLYRPGRPVAGQEGRAWEQVAFESLTKGAFQQLFDKLLPANAAELITFLGGVADVKPLAASRASTPTKPAKTPHYMAIPALKVADWIKDVPQRYKDLKHFDYSKQQAQPMERYNTELKLFWEGLPAQKPLAFEGLHERPDTLAVLDQGIEDRINGIGKDIKDKTVSLLNQLKEDIRDERIHKQLKNVPKGSSVERNDNVLVRLKNVREAIYGGTDEAVKVLDELIKSDVFISTKTPQYRVRMAEIIADHAILANAATRMANLEGANVPEQLRILEEARQVQERSLPHLISSSGVAKTDPLGNAAKGFEAIQAIFRQQNDMLGRVVREHASAMGWSSEPPPNSDEVVDLFRRLVNTMEPGDGLKLGKSSNNGFNTETFRLVLSGAWLKTSSGVAVAWVIPIVDIGRLKGVEMTIAKTDEGVTFEFKNTRAKYQQYGGRTGVGHVNLPSTDMPEKSGLLWGFEGWEIAIKGKKTNKTEDSIAFTIKDQGNGNIGKVVSEVMSGQADIFELMRQSEEKKSTHSKGRDWNLGVGNVGVLATGTEQPGWGKLVGAEGPGFDHAERAWDWDRVRVRDTLPGIGHVVDGLVAGFGALRSVGKILAAFVPEIALDFGSKKQKTESSNSKGETTVSETRQGFGLQSMRGNLIGVSVVETDYAKAPIPGDMTIGEASNNPSFLGRMGVPSLLPGAILGKSFDRLSPSSKTETLLSTADGSPTNISVDLRVTRTGTLLKKIDKDGTVRQQVPGLQKVFDTLLHQQGKRMFNHNKPISVSMELKPEVVNQQLPQGKEARTRKLKKLAKDLSNFRITGLSASRDHVGKQTRALAVPARTREIGATLTATKPLAKVDLVYDKQKLIDHGKGLLKSMSTFDDGAWGASSRAEHLTQLTWQLENIVDALGQDPVVWEHGESLKKDYQHQRDELKAGFMSKVRKLLVDPVSTAQLTEVTDALQPLVDKFDTLREETHCPPFTGPAVITAGPLFTKPAVGRLDEQTNLTPHAEADWSETREAIERLGGIDLSSLRGKELEKAKKAVKADIDSIKRTLNTVSDVDPGLKQQLIMELSVLAVRPSGPGQLENVRGMLDNLTGTPLGNNVQ